MLDADNPDAIRCKKPDNPFQKFDEIIRDFIALKDNKKVAIFSHRYLDPDALSSILGLTYLLKNRYEVESIGFYDGVLSNPQNIAVLQLLDMQLTVDTEYNAEEFGLNILVDTVPANASVGHNKIKFDIIVDHHKENPNGGFNGLFINEHSGSCCSTIYDMIKSCNLEFKVDNDQDVNCATGLLCGIYTDTETLLSEDVCSLDRVAAMELSAVANTEMLRKIMKFKIPLSWQQIREQSCHTIVDGTMAVGCGLLENQQRDILAYLADEFIRLDSVETCIVFAIIDNNRIEGSIRSNSIGTDVAALAKKLSSGNGGGKQNKAAYRIPLAGLECEEDSIEIREELWKLVDRKEKDKIFRIAKK